MCDLADKHTYRVQEFIGDNGGYIVSVFSYPDPPMRIMHDGFGLFYAEPAQRYICPNGLTELLHTKVVIKCGSYPIMFEYISMMNWTQPIIFSINHGELPLIEFYCSTCGKTCIGHLGYYEIWNHTLCNNCIANNPNTENTFRVTIPKINMLDWVIFMSDTSPEIHGGIFLINCNPDSVYYGKIMIGLSPTSELLDFIVMYNSIEDLVSDIHKWMLVNEKNTISRSFSVWCMRYRTVINIV